MNRRLFLQASSISAASLAFGGCRGTSGGKEMILACYEASRPLFRAVNRRFVEHLKKETGQTIRMLPTFGGSSKQSQVVADGLDASIVSLAVKPDVVHLVKKGLIDEDWESRFPNQSQPYSSTIVFVTRRGNPHDIQDWPHLVTKPNLSIIASNPKTGGASRLAFLAAWGAILKDGGSERDAEEYLKSLYRRVPILDSSSRASLVTFGRKLQGDVLLTWENEAYLAKREFGPAVEIVHPKRSILAVPPIAIVDANARRLNLVESARQFIDFLFTHDAQQLIAEEFYRPFDMNIHTDFPAIDRFRLESIVAGGWIEAQSRFFSDGGVFDRIYGTH
ncbi:MAG: sulfate ABC transporter substrate-binding protein [Gemmataceae bacterium]